MLIIEDFDSSLQSAVAELTVEWICELQDKSFLVKTLLAEGAPVKPQKVLLRFCLLYNYFSIISVIEWLIDTHTPGRFRAHVDPGNFRTGQIHFLAGRLLNHTYFLCLVLLE